MKVARIVGMAIFMLVSLSIWRLMDWVVILWPHPLMYVFAMMILSMLLVALPLRLLRPRTHFGWYLGIFAFFALISWWSGPLSKMATQSEEHVHCGRATYSGLLYPIKDYMFDAFQDDLDVRNQLCWIRKMITKVPPSFTEDEDLKNYYNLISIRLKQPYYKYRVALPAVLFLTGKILANWDFDTGPVSVIKTGKVFIEGFSYWGQIYDLHIRDRTYRWWEMPYGFMIQMEYGWIEANWQRITDSIQIDYQ